MPNTRFKKLLFICFVDFEKNIHITTDLCGYSEIGFYFGQKYIDKPGTLIFLNAVGGIRAVKAETLTLEEKVYFATHSKRIPE